MASGGEQSASGAQAAYFLAVHVGAGFHAPKRHKAYKQLMARACEAGAREVTAGKGPRAAVVAAVRVLEEHPLTNAGMGSNLNLHGAVEGDASVVDSDGNMGAVGAVPGTPSPVLVAEALAADSQAPLSLGRVRPLMLAGDSARKWAAERGLARAGTSEQVAGLHVNVTETSHCRWEHYSSLLEAAERKEQSPAAETTGHTPPAGAHAALRDELYDTVGAVCADGLGQMASAVSSGGIAMKFPGRVGEAGVLGAGCWAEVSGRRTCRESDSGSSSADDGGSSSGEAQRGASSGSRTLPRRGFACSVTGVGERIMQKDLARSCSTQLLHKKGLNVMERCAAAVREVGRLAPPNTAGIIALRLQRSRLPSREGSAMADDLGQQEGARRRLGLQVEFSATHNAESMGVGYLSSCNPGKPVTTMMARQDGSRHQQRLPKRLRAEGQRLVMRGTTVHL